MSKTLTIKLARERHAGVSSRTLQNMLLRGELKGKKVNGVWHIPVSELDRTFGGEE